MGPSMEPSGTPQLTLVTLNARITHNINLDYGFVSGRESSVKLPNQTAAVTPRDKKQSKVAI